MALKTEESVELLLNRFDRARTAAGQVALAAATPAMVLNEWAARRYAFIRNSGANDASLALGQGPVAGRGIVLPAGAWYEIVPGNLYTGQIWAVSTLGTALSIVEA